MMRQKQHLRLYFHICTSEIIPYNTDNLLFGQDNVIYFAINAPRLPGKPIGSAIHLRNKSSSTNQQYSQSATKLTTTPEERALALTSNPLLLEYLIYEVVVHPNVIYDITANPQYLNAVSLK